MCCLLSMPNWTFLLPTLVFTSSASSSLSLHAPRDVPPNVLPLGCPGSFFHPLLSNLFSWETAPPQVTFQSK